MRTLTALASANLFEDSEILTKGERFSPGQSDCKDQKTLLSRSPPHIKREELGAFEEEGPLG